MLFVNTENVLVVSIVKKVNLLCFNKNLSLNCSKLCGTKREPLVSTASVLLAWAEGLRTDGAGRGRPP